MEAGVNTETGRIVLQTVTEELDQELEFVTTQLLLTVVQSARVMLLKQRLAIVSHVQVSSCQLQSIKINWKIVMINQLELPTERVLHNPRGNVFL